MEPKNQYGYTNSSYLKKSPKELSMAYSWPGIIVLLLLFLPLGLYVLYKRYTIDKTAMLKNSKNVSVIAYMLIAIGIVYLIMAFSVDSRMIIATIFFCGVGIYLLFVSIRMKVEGERYMHYIDLIVYQSQSSIDNIAAEVRLPYDLAKKDLQKMIDYGYFTEAYIRNREFILPGRNPKPQSQGAASTEKTQTKVITCKGCGASNSVIVGQTSECEYCGTPIQ